MLSSAAVAAIVFLVAGFAILIYAGDCLVRGALAAAYKSNISPLLVGILISRTATSSARISPISCWCWRCPP